jgi:hypothetical protein
MQPSPGTISVPSPHGRPCTMRRKTVHMARGIDACITASAGACVEILGTARMFRISSCTCSRRGAGRVDALVSRMLWTDYECTFAAVTALQRRALRFVLKSILCAGAQGSRSIAQAFVAQILRVQDASEDDGRTDRDITGQEERAQGALLVD